MAYATGLGIALLTYFFARLSGLDRGRGFYPTIVIVTASYYVLFAAIDSSPMVLLVESLVVVVFTGLALAGFRYSLWVAAAALAAHGMFDVVHGKLIDNPGMPAWWPAFCMTFDIVLAACLVYHIQQHARKPATIS
jgi:hypothetical protein